MTPGENGGATEHPEVLAPEPGPSEMFVPPNRELSTEPANHRREPGSFRDDMDDMSEETPSIGPESPAGYDIHAGTPGPDLHPFNDVPEPEFIPESELIPAPDAGSGQDEPRLFAHYERQPPPAPHHTPNLGDLLIFLMLGVGGYLGSGLIVLAGLHWHLFGISTLKQATTEIHYTLGSQVAWYLTTIGVCAVSFPMVWHRSFLNGLEWRAEAAIRLRVRLISAAMVCFVLALVDGFLIPGPPDTPIDQIFRIPGAAWLLFGFGVTLAPLFEEITFRGFLLPALCTAYDWIAEKVSRPSNRALDSPALDPNFPADLLAGADVSQEPAGTPPPPLKPHWTAKWAPPPGPGDGTWAGPGGKPPEWSFPAMVVGSFLTSIPFALMHGEQTGYSVGPFVLLMCVSLVLCAVRLTARSLASSVLVHSFYNLLLFTLMLAGTGGFRHLDRM